MIKTFDPQALGLKVSSTSGNEYIVSCPFHPDGNPSGSFNPVSGLFYCFSCGATSTAEKLARHLGGQVLQTTKSQLAKKLPSQDWKSILSSPLAKDHPYLKARGVTNRQVKTWGIRALPQAIGFPIPDKNGKEVGILIRKEKGTPRYLYFGKKVPLYPLQWLLEQPRNSRIYVVEGVFGMLRAEKAGLKSVAVMGASIQKDVGLYLRSFQNVIGLFDHDFAGYCGAGRLLAVVPNAKIIIPGNEADELSLDDWRELDEGILTTRSVTRLAILSGDKKRFYKQLTFPRKFV